MTRVEELEYLLDNLKKCMENVELEKALSYLFKIREITEDLEDDIKHLIETANDKERMIARMLIAINKTLEQKEGTDAANI